MAQVFLKFLNLLVLNIDGTSFGNWSSEEENVRLWLVQHVMNPTWNENKRINVIGVAKNL